MMNRNTIAFRKKMITSNEFTDNIDNIATNKVANFQHLLMAHGYMLDNTSYFKLRHMTKIDELISDITSYLKEVMGEKISIELKDIRQTYDLNTVRLSKYEKIFGLINFQSENYNSYNTFDSYCQQIWDGTLITDEEVPQIYENVKFKTVKFVDEDTFKNIFTDFAQLNVALTPVDFKIIEWFASEYGSSNHMPTSIPFKENLCMLASLGLDVPVKTPTDVLRIATYMSNGSTDLILPHKMLQANSWSRMLIENPARKEAHFKKFSRSERRYLLGLLNGVADSKEMVLRKQRWIKLGEILHPGEYTKRFPMSAKAFYQLRNTNVKSWYSDLDKEFARGFEFGLDKLSERPGEFARRLDSLLRTNEFVSGFILEKFEKVSDRVSSKVLWELYSHFGSRTSESSRRITIPGSRIPIDLSALEVMSEELVGKIQSTIVRSITKKYTNLDKLGKVYLDEKLRKIPVPTNMRTLEESAEVIIRGTRLPLPTGKKVIRPYIHWEAKDDLDLSISLIDYDGNTRVCSYSCMNPHASISHSGDVVPEKVGKWAEYIDINIDKNPFKYGLLTVTNYNGNALNSVNARVGFMMRDHLKSSKSWSPNTIETSYKLTSESSNVNLLVMDFETNEWILIDEDSRKSPMAQSNDILAYIKLLSEEPKLSVYDVLEMHTEARGEQVETKEDSDISFNFDDFSKSYEKIASYML